MRTVKILDDTEVRAHWTHVLQAFDLKRAQERWQGPSALEGIINLFFLRGALRAVIDREDHGLDGDWLHVSVSRTSGRLPEYAEMAEVRRSFIPADRSAVEVWPPVNEHVSLAEVRHLWCRLDVPTVPDLRCIVAGVSGV